MQGDAISKSAHLSLEVQASNKEAFTTNSKTYCNASTINFISSALYLDPTNDALMVYFRNPVIFCVLPLIMGMFWGPGIFGLLSHQTPVSILQSSRVKRFEL